MNGELSNDSITIKRTMLKKSGYKNTLVYKILNDGNIDVLQASRVIAADLVPPLKNAGNRE